MQNTSPYELLWRINVKLIILPKKVQIYVASVVTGAGDIHSLFIITYHIHKSPDLRVCFCKTCKYMHSVSLLITDGYLYLRNSSYNHIIFPEQLLYFIFITTYFKMFSVKIYTQNINVWVIQSDFPLLFIFSPIY